MIETRAVPVYASMECPGLYRFRPGPGRRPVGAIRLKPRESLRGMTAAEAIETATIEMRVEWARTDQLTRGFEYGRDH